MAVRAAVTLVIGSLTALFLLLPAPGEKAAAGDAFDTADVEASVVRVIAPQSDPNQASIGTGWIVHGRRIVVTNNHVIEGGVTFHLAMLVDGKPKIFDAKLLRRSPEKDLAVLEALSDLPGKALPLAGYETKAMTRVIAIGFPGNADMAYFPDRSTGQLMAVRFTTQDDDFYRPTWTEGVASRNISYFRTLDGPALQHSADINKGNSGGPLIDACGRVLGVNTIRAIDENPQGVFYAIHPKEIIRFLEVASFTPKTISKPCTITSASTTVMLPMLVATFALAAASLWLAWRRQVPAVVRPLTAVANRVSRVAIFGGGDGRGKPERNAPPRNDRAPRNDPPRSPAPAPAPQARRERAMTLVPKAPGPEFAIDREKLDDGKALIVGRSRSSDVVLSHESVSRRHARMWLDKDGALWIEDLGSSAGTFVGPDRIRKATLVPPGVSVRFGAVGYTFYLGRNMPS